MPEIPISEAAIELLEYDGRPFWLHQEQR